MMQLKREEWELMSDILGEEVERIEYLIGEPDEWDSVESYEEELNERTPYLDRVKALLAKISR